MTLVVGMARSYWAERRYVLGVVLGEWLGLEWRPEEHRHADVRIRLDGEDDRVVTLPDVLFATDRARWLTTAALPREPLPRRAVGDVGAGVLTAN